MLERFFWKSDQAIDRFTDWCEARGAVVLILYAIVAYGSFALVDCAIYVWRYTH